MHLLERKTNFCFFFASNSEEYVAHITYKTYYFRKNNRILIKAKIKVVYLCIVKMCLLSNKLNFLSGMAV